jgi:hypothetical protein
VVVDLVVEALLPQAHSSGGRALGKTESSQPAPPRYYFYYLLSFLFPPRPLTSSSRCPVGPAAGREGAGSSGLDGRVPPAPAAGWGQFGSRARGVPAGDAGSAAPCVPEFCNVAAAAAACLNPLLEAHPFVISFVDTAPLLFLIFLWVRS